MTATDLKSTRQFLARHGRLVLVAGLLAGVSCCPLWLATIVKPYLAHCSWQRPCSWPPCASVPGKRWADCSDLQRCRCRSHRHLPNRRSAGVLFRSALYWPVCPVLVTATHADGRGPVDLRLPEPHRHGRPRPGPGLAHVDCRNRRGSLYVVHCVFVRSRLRIFLQCGGRGDQTPAAYWRGYSLRIYAAHIPVSRGHTNIQERRRRSFIFGDGRHCDWPDDSRRAYLEDRSPASRNRVAARLFLPVMDCRSPRISCSPTAIATASGLLTQSVPDAATTPCS